MVSAAVVVRTTSNRYRFEEVVEEEEKDIEIKIFFFVNILKYFIQLHSLSFFDKKNVGF